MSDCAFLITPFIQGPPTYLVEQYRARAERLRVISGDLVSEEWRDIMLRLADCYEELATSTRSDQL